MLIYILLSLYLLMGKDKKIHKSRTNSQIYITLGRTEIFDVFRLVEITTYKIYMYYS